MKFTQDYRLLFGAVIAFFLSLTLLIAILPALSIQDSFAPLPNSVPLNQEEFAGKKLYIANGCIACHTQQVRNVAMDRMWGERPSIAADYAGITRTSPWQNTATLMGSERTGPDLTTIGSRQPSSAWQLMHLYNPRSVVAASIMPAYPWLFEQKAHAAPLDTVVSVPDAYKRGTGQIVAKKEALQLVAYLLSLKQTPLPDGTAPPNFLYQVIAAPGAQTDATASGGVVEPNGAALYTANCQVCHQANGEGLKGAFPPLKASPIVLDDSPERMITIIMKGYNGREKEGYPVMPPIGAINHLKPAEIRAIINHERSTWGNNARAVPLDEVEKILQSLAP